MPSVDGFWLATIYDDKYLGESDAFDLLQDPCSYHERLRCNCNF